MCSLNGSMMWWKDHQSKSQETWIVNASSAIYWLSNLG